MTVSPSPGHGCCPASLGEIRSEDVQYVGPGSGEGEVPEGLREGVPGQPPEAAAGAARRAGGDPGAVPGAGPRQQLCPHTGEEEG